MAATRAEAPSSSPLSRGTAARVNSMELRKLSQYTHTRCWPCSKQDGPRSSSVSSEWHTGGVSSIEGNGAPTVSVSYGVKNRRHLATTLSCPPLLPDPLLPDSPAEELSAWYRASPRSSKTSTRKRSFFLRLRAASTNPLLAMPASTVRVKNSALARLKRPSNTTPGCSALTEAALEAPPPLPLLCCANSLARPSTSGLTLVGMGTPSLATCAAKNLPSHPTFSTSTASMLASPLCPPPSSAP
mmetsp:Transcript_88762/g.177470  ORF Transcript_88762/g.177470 Transcript_88762/m.177470 type:complete len:243 (-) Transcript_88762:262-990(-)